jgi:hypothetical protein
LNLKILFLNRIKIKAYGQTGSGKSYSVVGYGKNRGIVPMVCEEIFTSKSPIAGATTEVNRVYFTI